jgi:hypothetical protein
VVEVVDTESAAEVVPGSVIVCGEKLHDEPAGSPEQLNETAELNPFTGVTNIVVAPLSPADTVADAGDAATLKSGVAGPETTTLTVFDVLPAKLPSPA